MKTPFGKSAAAIRLAEMVENDPKSRSYVSSTLSELTETLYQLNYISNCKTRRHLCNLVKDSFLKRLQSGTRPPLVNSFLKNLIITRCRIIKRVFDESNS